MTRKNKKTKTASTKKIPPTPGEASPATDKPSRDANSTATGASTDSNIAGGNDTGPSASAADSNDSASTAKHSAAQSLENDSQTVDQEKSSEVIAASDQSVSAASNTNTMNSKSSVSKASVSKPSTSNSGQSNPGPSHSGPSDNASKTMTAANKANNQSKAVWLGLLVVAVLAVAASGYVWQQGQRQQLSLQSDINAALQRVDQQSENARLLQREVDRMVAAAKQQQLQNDEVMQLVKKQLQSQHRRLQSLSTTDRDDWLLAEAEYLIRLANQRLLMGKEVAGALELLDAADAIARELDDSALFTVREALAKDMAALRHAGKLDVDGVYLTLGALALQADQLRLFTMPVLAVAAVEINNEPQTWRQRLDSGLAAAWRKLSDYIQIKRRDETYKPLLAPEYETAVRQNVRLMFEQSQMALLAGKQTLYADSLNKVSEWLNNYYTLDNEKTAVLISRVDEMKAIQVAVKLPDISGSLRALKNYVELIHDVKHPLTKATSQSAEQQKKAEITKGAQLGAKQ